MADPAPTPPRQDVRHYQNEGWVVPQARLDADYIERLRQCLEEVMAQNPDIRPERLVSAHTEERGAEGVQGSTEFLALARHPTLLEAVAQLAGGDLGLWGCQIFCKPGGDGMEVPMHQDGEYWPIKPLATVTAWVALDRSDKENGCLRVVPKSHASKCIFEHETSNKDGLVLTRTIKDSALSPLPEPVDVELEPGQFSLHDVFLVHGSNANKSSRRRAGVAFRYMPTTSLLERDSTDVPQGGYTIDWKNRPIFLLSGQDRSAGRNTYSVLPPVLALPPGFAATAAAVAPSTWQELQRWLQEDTSIPWERAIEGRRVAQWGVRYDYDKQEVDLTPVASIPPKLRELLPQVGPGFTQCIINEYGPADGIPWHVDDLVFGPEILVFVFGEARPLRLRRTDSETSMCVDIGHLWSYSFQGESRYGWQHSIPEGLGNRLSVTFRSLAA
ncbi:unnamed protein product [Symbiodinium natans]|uniref:Fe2OG dioxygenase domain-containing protein n=1 Tax=Symbiodinium natans TaxID=878477 RepID=A0A812L5G7_9DINO|nr:unnamed protein product [Symbiodinium natans]